MTTVDTDPGPTSPPADLDPGALEAFMGHASQHATAAVNAALVGLGDSLGLWKAMAGAGPVTPAELAVRAGVGERLLTEWLASQAANGFVTYHGDDRFSLTTEAAMVLAHEDSPALMIGAFQGVAVLARSLPVIAQAFRAGSGVAWADHDPEFFDVQERFSRPLQRQFLVDAWLAGVPGLVERLRDGATVADVGCGYGTSTLLLAETFPESRFTGFDFHDHSIARARQAARLAGLSDRVAFEVADARSFPGDGYDLVLFVDSLHDMGDPVAAARHARSSLAPGGVLVTLDPVAADSLDENLANPMSALMYGISTFLCTPTALAQGGTHALGAQGGERAIRGVLTAAGFGDVRRVAPDAPMNMVLVARD